MRSERQGLRVSEVAQLRRIVTPNNTMDAQAKDVDRKKDRDYLQIQPIAMHGITSSGQERRIGYALQADNSVQHRLQSYGSRRHMGVGGHACHLQDHRGRVERMVGANPWHDNPKWIGACLHCCLYGGLRGISTSSRPMHEEHL